MSTGRYALGRLAIGLLQVLGVVTLVFLLTEALPGDAAVIVAGDAPDPERIRQLRETMRLDLPVWQRYLEWLGGLLTGDPGSSAISGRPVSSIISAALPPTLLLAVSTLVLLVPLSLGLGLTSANRPGSLLDRTLSATTLGLYAVPEFASAILLIALFSLKLGWLPATALGADLLTQPAVVILPIVVLLVRPVCSVSRLVRAGMITALDAPYARHLIRLGISRRRLVWTHALPTAAAPAIQQLARTTDWLLGGVIVVEALFVIPGLGTALVDAVGARDVPVIQALAVLFGCVTVIVNLAADLFCARLDPRTLAR